jgi:hypothetical protein
MAMANQCFVIRAFVKRDSGIDLSPKYFIGGGQLDSHFDKSILFQSHVDAEHVLASNQIIFPTPSIVEIISIYKYF